MLHHPTLDTLQARRLLGMAKALSEQENMPGHHRPQADGTGPEG